MQYAQSGSCPVDEEVDMELVEVTASAPSNTAEMEAPASSPARSSAALALASMFHVKPPGKARYYASTSSGFTSTKCKSISFETDFCLLITLPMLLLTNRLPTKNI